MPEVSLPNLRLPKIYGSPEVDLVTYGIAFEEVTRLDHKCAVIYLGTARQALQEVINYSKIIKMVLPGF